MREVEALAESALITAASLLADGDVGAGSALDDESIDVQAPKKIVGIRERANIRAIFMRIQSDL